MKKLIQGLIAALATFGCAAALQGAPQSPASSSAAVSDTKQEKNKKPLPSSEGKGSKKTIRSLAYLQPFSLHDAIHLNALFLFGSTPALSTDGRWFAYTANDSGRKNQDSAFGPASPEVLLTVVDVKTGREIRLGDKDTRNGYPQWSPDSRWLAYISNRDGEFRLWGWNSVTGENVRLSEAVLYPINSMGHNLLWTPDSQNVIARLARPGTVRKVEQISTRSPGSTERYDLMVNHAAASTGGVESSLTDIKFEEAITDQFAFDLGVIKVNGGAPRILVQKVAGSGDMSLSPDGTQLAYIAEDVRASGAIKAYRNPSLVSDLTVVALSGGAPKVLAPDCLIGYEQTVLRWSPDGRELLYTTNPILVTEKEGAYVVSVRDGAAPRRLTAGVFTDALWSAEGDSVLLVGDPHPQPATAGSVQDFGRGTPGLWHLKVSSGELRELTPRDWDRRILSVFHSDDGRTYWSRDAGRSVLIFARDDLKQRDGFWKVSLSSGQLQKLKEEDQRYVPFAVSRAGAVIYSAQDVQHPENIWISNSDFRQPARQLSHLNPQLESYVFGAGQVIQYRSTGYGEELLGGLVLPADYVPGRRYPLIAIIYPIENRFDMPQMMRRFNNSSSYPSPQLFATRGFAVLYPSSPTHFGTPMKSMAEGIMPAIDRAIELGVADADRLGIRGHSYGGYSTIAMITQTPRFKAAVASAASGNLVSMTLTRIKLSGGGFYQWARGQGKMTGSLWERRSEYIENSPVFYLDRVQTPLLMLHGDQDHVPYWLADEVFVGLKELGKEVEYRLYHGEDHVISQEENVLDALGATLRWFETYLKAPDAALARK